MTSPPGAQLDMPKATACLGWYQEQSISGRVNFGYKCITGVGEVEQLCLLGSSCQTSDALPKCPTFLPVEKLQYGARAGTIRSSKCIGYKLSLDILILYFT